MCKNPLCLFILSHNSGGFSSCYLVSSIVIPTNQSLLCDIAEKVLHHSQQRGTVRWMIWQKCPFTPKHFSISNESSPCVSDAQDQSTSRFYAHNWAIPLQAFICVSIDFPCFLCGIDGRADLQNTSTFGKQEITYSYCCFIFFGHALTSSTEVF